MGLGMPEVLLILVIALIVFGPRKLPELGKSLGQAMAQFRKASDDFKRTWEQEVELEKVKTSADYSSYNSPYSSNGGSNDPYNPYEHDSHLNDSTKDSATDSSAAQLPPEAGNIASEETVKTTSTAESSPRKNWI